MSKKAADYTPMINEINGEAGDLDRAVTCLREAAVLLKRAEDILNGADPDETEDDEPDDNEIVAEDVKEDPEVPEVSGLRHHQRAGYHFQRLDEYHLKNPLAASYKRSLSSLLRQMVRSKVARHRDWPKLREKSGWSYDISDLTDTTLFQFAEAFGIDVDAIKAEAEIIRADDLRMSLGLTPSGSSKFVGDRVSS